MIAAWPGADEALLAEREAELERLAPGYLGQVRGVQARLGVRDPDSSDSAAALEAVEELALIDIAVPTGSRRPAGRLAKTIIARCIAWYLRYLGGQITALGQAVAHLGGILVDRTEHLEKETAQLRVDLERLQARIRQLDGDADGPAR